MLSGLLALSAVVQVQVSDDAAASRLKDTLLISTLHGVHVCNTISGLRDYVCSAGSSRDSQRGHIL